MSQKNTGSGYETLRLLTCVGVDLELAHLPHFLRHYIGLGILPSNIHVIVNAESRDAPNFTAAEAMVAEAGAPPPRRWIGTYTSDGMWAERRRLQRDVAGARDWILNADVDEHHRYPAPVPGIVRHCQAKGYNCVQGFLIDRLAPGGELAAVSGEFDLSRQFPLEAAVDLALVPRGQHHGTDGTVKLMLHRGDVLPSRGGHNPHSDGAEPRFLAGRRLARFDGATDPAYRFAYPFRVDHYKWTASRADTFRRRLEAPGVSPAGREVGGKMNAYLSEHGRIRLEDVAVRPESRRRAASWRLLTLRQRLWSRAVDVRGRLRARSA